MGQLGLGLANLLKAIEQVRAQEKLPALRLQVVEGQMNQIAVFCEKAAQTMSETGGQGHDSCHSTWKGL